MSETTEMPDRAGSIDGERGDLLEALRWQRAFLLTTVRGLDDADAWRAPTASALYLAALLHHVTAVEAEWTGFIERGPEALTWAGDGAQVPTATEGLRPDFVPPAGATLADLVAAYEQVAARTEELVATLPSLDASRPLPEAPWFEPGASWSARRVLLHVVAETAQHCGHADIVRETIDGQKTMG